MPRPVLGPMVSASVPTAGGVYGVRCSYKAKRGYVLPYIHPAKSQIVPAQLPDRRLDPMQQPLGLHFGLQWLRAFAWCKLACHPAWKITCKRNVSSDVASPLTHLGVRNVADSKYIVVAFQLQCWPHTNAAGQAVQDMGQVATQHLSVGYRTSCPKLHSMGDWNSGKYVITNGNTNLQVGLD